VPSAPPQTPKLGLLHGRNNSTGRELQRVTQNSITLAALERLPTSTKESQIKFDETSPSTSNPSSIMATAQQKRKKAIMQVLLLEMGILFHSVFIGMALSVAVGNDFIVLLIAITFHREFPISHSQFFLDSKGE
jgi:hypothetical protein